MSNVACDSFGAFGLETGFQTGRARDHLGTVGVYVSGMLCPIHLLHLGVKQAYLGIGYCVEFRSRVHCMLLYYWTPVSKIFKHDWLEHWSERHGTEQTSR